MQVTKDVFTTNVQNANLSGLGTDSTKRLLQHCASQFPTKLDGDGYVEADVKFDSRAREVLRKYELKKGETDCEVKYLDSMKYGGRYRPEEIIQQIKRFQSCHAPSFRWNRNYQKALKEVQELTTPMMSKLKILEYRNDGDFKDALPKSSAHSGFEFIVTGRRTKGECIEGARDQFMKELEHARVSGSFGKPITTLHRLQDGGAYTVDGERTGEHKQKSRLVSAVDVWQVFAEMMWAKPFQRHFHTRSYYAGGKEPRDLRHYIAKQRNEHRFWISLDYSKFDQSIPSWLIRDAFSIVWNCFSDCESWRWLWNIIVNDFVNKAFIGPGGKLYYAENGVPSGSMFTQIIDTICNLIMIHTYMNALHSKGTKVKYQSIICGDDNLIFSNQPLPLDDLEGYLKRNFGVECNAAKCAVGERKDDPIFLSRVWTARGEWRQPKELIAKLLYPERFRPYDRIEELTPELIVYSYILAFPLGMEELIDVERFMKDNFKEMKRAWSSAVFEYQSGYLSYTMRYETPSSMIA